MTATSDVSEQRIQTHQGLVRSLAAKIHKTSAPNVDLDDLVGYGQIGLVQADRDFDADRGAQFATYAYYRVRGAIYDGLSKMSWTSRSRYNRIRYEQLANETLQAQAQAATGSSSDSLAEDLRWLSDTSGQLAVVCLATGAGETDAAAQLADPGAGTPAAAAASHELEEKVRSLIESLPTTLGVLVRLVYFEGHTLQDAATSLGMSKSWASRLHTKALQQLAFQLKKVDAQD